tara:strand:- start:3024 stop:3446 length:423 start_codon:yes stop_codon:yes gene_type:complete
MKWDKLTDEEQKQILADLRKKWPRFKNTHPRQLWKGKSTTNGWREYELEDFILRMDKGLFLSWREFKREYENQRFEELEENINNASFWKNYGEKFPDVLQMISEIVFSRRMNFEKTQKFIRLMLKHFRPDGWPIRRGEEE